MMKPSLLNLEIHSNATFDQLLTWKDSDRAPVDLTGWTAKMQVRDAPESDEALLELTTENDRIELGDDEGTIRLTVTKEDVEALTFSHGVYDLLMVAPDDTVHHLLLGRVTVIPGVTR